MVAGAESTEALSDTAVVSEVDRLELCSSNLGVSILFSGPVSRN
jgi:hypothetical protein